MIHSKEWESLISLRNSTKETEMIERIEMTDLVMIDLEIEIDLNPTKIEAIAIICSKALKKLASLS